MTACRSWRCDQRASAAQASASRSGALSGLHTRSGHALAKNKTGLSSGQSGFPFQQSSRPVFNFHLQPVH